MCGQGEASGHSIDRLAARNCFGRVHDAKDGNVVSVSEALQPGKHAAHGGHLVCVHLIAEKGVERIDHDQTHVADLFDLFAKLFEVALQAR